MGTLPLSEVKSRPSEIADEVDQTHERVHITRKGRECALLLSAEDRESLEATVEFLRDDADDCIEERSGPPLEASTPASHARR